MAFVLAFAADSDTLIRSAYWTGIAAIVFTILFFATVLFMRASSIAHQRRRRKMLKGWRPALADAMRGEIPAELPKLRHDDLLYLLQYWNYVYLSASAEGRDRLRTVGYRVGLNRTSLKLARSNQLWKQLLGLESLGHLRERQGIDTLRKAVASSDNVVSMTAATALMDVEPEAAVGEVMPLMASRHDWTETRMADMLIAAGPERVSQPLIAQLRSAKPKEQARIIRLIGATASGDALSAVCDLLRSYEHDRSPEIVPAILAGLRVLESPEDRDVVHAYLAHPDWHVREQAAQTLGRMATRDDERPLSILLHDDHWWVRYRAAQSLARVPDVTLDDLRERTMREDNQATQEILRHVLAERQLA